MALTDTHIKTAKPAEKIYKYTMPMGYTSRSRHPAANGGGSRFKYRLGGKEKRISLGTCPEIGYLMKRKKLVLPTPTSSANGKQEISYPVD